MTIHHATVKRAAALGIILTQEEGEDTVTALHAQRGIQLEGDDPKALIVYVAVAAKLKIEWPGVTINDEGSASTDAEEDFFQIDADDTIDNNFAALLEAMPEGEEDEEGTGTVVVAERYKAEYKARGDASGCGDWLHRTLKRYSTEAIDAGKKTTIFDEAGFTKMLIANGVVVKGKFADMPEAQSKGWEGRYRMNGRQMLESHLLRAKGVLVLENGKSTVVMPDEDYDALLNLKRHRSLKEALETEEAEADAAAAKKGRARKAK